MKTIGIKLADGSFYPVLKEDQPEEKTLELTTAHNNQTRVMVDLYRSETSTMDDAEYVDTLQIDNLNEHPNGVPSISFVISIDAENQLSAKIKDVETGNSSKTTITLVNRTLEERLEDEPADYDISETAVEESEVMQNLADNEVKQEDVSESASEENLESEATTEETITEPEDDSAINLDETVLLADIKLDPYAFVDKDEVENKTEVEEANEVPAEETIATEVEETQVEEETMNSNDETLNENSVFDDLPDFSDINIDEKPEEKSDFDFEMDDIEDSSFSDPANDTIAETSIFDDLPDFDEPASDGTKADDDPFNFDEPINNNTKIDDDPFSFDLDESPVTKNDNINLDDDSFGTSGGLTFDGLYDEETELGNSSGGNETKNKTRVPVVICVICAIICIIAVLLILFVIPSDFNLLSKFLPNKEKEPIVAELIQEEKLEPIVETKNNLEPIAEVEQIPEAKEDEVIIIEKAEEVKPEPPAPPKVEPEDIIYTVRWGDTLWDIAATYYKDPWRYKKIAKYNGIDNPDYIISGTVIRIPQE